MSWTKPSRLAFSARFAPSDCVRGVVRRTPLRQATLAAGLLASALHLVAADAVSAKPGLALWDAVRTTLSMDPQIKIQAQELEAAQGRALEESGAFDTRLTTGVTRGLEQDPVRSPLTGPNTYQRQTLHRTTAQAGAQKRLRNGVSFGPSVQVTRLEDSLSAVEPENRAELSFTVTVPLARGRGTSDSAAEEKAARTEVEASRHALRHAVSSRVLNATTAYWNYVAAAERDALQQRSRTQAEELLGRTRQLVDAAEVPASEVDQLAANVEDKAAAQLRSAQELLEARHELGLALGLPYEQLSGIPMPETPFPAPEAGQLAATGSPEGLTAQAVMRREDLRSARLGLDANLVLRDAARKRLRPRVDLVLQGGYAGVDGSGKTERYFSSFYEHVTGLNAQGSLVLEFPPANRAARGRLADREAVCIQGELRADDLERSIRSSVLVAWERLRSSLQQLRRAEAAATDYERAVKSERQKRQLGLSTFTDVLLLEDRLIGASLARIEAHLLFATSLVRLRHETGLLISGSDARGTVAMEDLVTLPSAPFPPPPSLRP